MAAPPVALYLDSQVRLQLVASMALPGLLLPALLTALARGMEVLAVTVTHPGHGDMRAMVEALAEHIARPGEGVWLAEDWPHGGRDPGSDRPHWHGVAITSRGGGAVIRAWRTLAGMESIPAHTQPVTGWSDAIAGRSPARHPEGLGAGLAGWISYATKPWPEHVGERTVDDMVASGVCADTLAGLRAAMVPARACEVCGQPLSEKATVRRQQHTTCGARTRKQRQRQRDRAAVVQAWEQAPLLAGEEAMREATEAS